jgi:ABC-2 type transport system permease protein
VRTLGAVVRKDLVQLWTSPLPWVAGAAFQAVLGLLVVDQLAARQQAVVQPLFPIAGLLLVVTVPVLTMRALAEEARTGSLDLLLAVPVAPAPLVVGKWLACWLTALALVLPAGVHVVLTHLWGAPDRGPVLAGFLGLALLAAALSGVGVLASSATATPAVAGLAAAMAGLVLWFAGTATGGAGTGVVAAVSFSERLRTFAAGAVDSGDAVFLLAVVAGTLVAATAVLDLRRLR